MDVNFCEKSLNAMECLNKEICCSTNRENSYTLKEQEQLQHGDLIGGVERDGYLSGGSQKITIFSIQ
jgi:hypothetical protein